MQWRTKIIHSDPIFSYDHRVIDGVAAAEFGRYIGTVLADIREILL